MNKTIAILSTLLILAACGQEKAANQAPSEQVLQMRQKAISTASVVQNTLQQETQKNR